MRMILERGTVKESEVIYPSKNMIPVVSFLPCTIHHQISDDEPHAVGCAGSPLRLDSHVVDEPNTRNASLMISGIQNSERLGVRNETMGPRQAH